MDENTFHSLRVLVVSPKYEGVKLSDDGKQILCAPEHEAIGRGWQENPLFFDEMRALRKLLAQVATTGAAAASVYERLKPCHSKRYAARRGRE